MGANNLIEPIDPLPVFTAFSATFPLSFYSHPARSSLSFRSVISRRRFFRLGVSSDSRDFARRPERVRVTGRDTCHEETAVPGALATVYRSCYASFISLVFFSPALNVTRTRTRTGTRRGTRRGTSARRGATDISVDVRLNVSKQHNLSAEG